MAELTLGLQNLRRQTDRRFPHRDRQSDGWIGDAAHQAHASGHNPDDTSGSSPAWNADADNKAEVRAWDQDSDLGEPGITAQMEVDHIRRLPGVAAVIRYIIYDHKIYHERVGFAPAPYAGPSPHTEHIHFEGAWSNTGDSNTTFDFRLDELGGLPMDQATFNKLMTGWAKSADGQGALANAVLNARIDDKANPARTVGDRLRDGAKIRGVLAGDKNDTANAALPSTAPLAKLLAMPADIAGIKAALAGTPSQG